MNEEMLRKLVKLRDDTNTIIAGLSPEKVLGPINWGALRCVETRMYITDSGDSGFTVAICEASPNNNDLHVRVIHGLTNIGWREHIEVVTEW